MKKMNTIKVACTSLVLGTALSVPAYAEKPDAGTVPAGHTKNMSQGADARDSATNSRSLEQKSSDAWREGKLDTIYLFNRHLNNFTIDPEVRGNTAILTGKVESEVDRELAEQIAKGVDGITTVTNRLTVVPSEEARAGVDEANRSFSDKVEDATLTAEVKTKLLANSETSGLAISVDTVARNVTLTGKVDSSAEKDLAETITEQVDGVSDVVNKLQVKS